MYPPSYRRQQQAMNQFNHYYGNNISQHQFLQQQRSRNINDSGLMNQSRHQHQLSMTNYTQNNIMSPNIGDENRLFAFYSPSNKDIYSPQAFHNQSGSMPFHFMNSSVHQREQFFQRDLNHQKDQAGQNEELNHQQIINSIRHSINNPISANQGEDNGDKTEADKKQELVEQKLQNYSSIVMQQTFFNHLSLQIFFILVLIMIIYQMKYITVLVFLWIVDIISFCYSFKRSKIELLVDETKAEDMNNIWRLLETLFSIVFKICLYIYLEVNKYKFYYVPCTLLIYVLIRFFFVISKKLTENGPISSLLNESFTWGFKIFFVGQLFLIAIKMNDKIDWSWQDVFWPYWVFFYIMIGTNSVFVILLLSKVLLRCLGQPVQSFEIKGLFWFFMLSNGLCVNSTLFVRGIVGKLDHSRDDDAHIAFKYSLVFMCLFVIYTAFFWKGIWIFMFHFSQEREDTECDDNNSKNQSGIKGKGKKKKNKKRHLNQQQGDPENEKEDEQNKADDQEDEEDDDKDDEEEEEDDEDNQNDDIYGDDENYPQGQFPESESGRNRNNVNQQNRQNQNHQNNNSDNQQQVININENPQIPQQKPKSKKKIFKKVSLNKNNNQKKGFPLFLEKLSSTYFTALTNNGMKSKKEKEQQKKENQQKQIKKLVRSNTQMDKDDKRSISQIDLGKNKDQQKGDVNKSDIQTKQKQDKIRQKLQNKIESPKGLSDSVGKIDISFNDNDGQNIKPPNPQNQLQNIAYETQMKFSKLISSPKGQELKKREQEKKFLEQNKQSLIQNSYQDNYVKENAKQNQQDTSQLSQIEKESGDESNANCVICFENEPDTVYLPCGHGGICYECAMDVMKKTGECYLCRNEIKQVVQIDYKSKDAQKKIIAITAALEEKTEHNDGDKSIINVSQINIQNSDITDRNVSVSQSQVENNVAQQNSQQIQLNQQQSIQSQQIQNQQDEQQIQQQLQQQQQQQQQQVLQEQQQNQQQLRNNQGIVYVENLQSQPLSPHWNIPQLSPQQQNQIQDSSQHQQPAPTFGTRQINNSSPYNIPDTASVQRNNVNSLDLAQRKDVNDYDVDDDGINKENEQVLQINGSVVQKHNNILIQGTQNKFLMDFSQDLEENSNDKQDL